MKNAKSVSWELFTKTGSPGAYLLYCELAKDERKGSNLGGKT